MSGGSKAVFLSYASEDSEAAQRIADDPDLCYLRRYPLFKALEGEPRYREFLRKLDLPQ